MGRQPLPLLSPVNTPVLLDAATQLAIRFLGFDNHPHDTTDPALPILKAPPRLNPFLKDHDRNDRMHVYVEDYMNVGIPKNNC